MEVPNSQIDYGYLSTQPGSKRHQIMGLVTTRISSSDISWGGYLSNTQEQYFRVYRNQPFPVLGSCPWRKDPDHRVSPALSSESWNFRDPESWNFRDPETFESPGNLSILECRQIANNSCDISMNNNQLVLDCESEDGDAINILVIENLPWSSCEFQRFPSREEELRPLHGRRSFLWVL